MLFLSFVNSPALPLGGLIAAIIICCFILIVVLLAVAFNLAMVFGATWIRDKSELLKLLRPYVESVNKTSELTMKGGEPAASENPLVRTLGSMPARMQDIDKKVDKATDRVAHAVIEFRARTVQVQTIAKAFLMPGLIKRPARLRPGEDGLALSASERRALAERQAPEVSVEAAHADGHAQPVEARQLTNAPAD